MIEPYLEPVPPTNYTMVLNMSRAQEHVERAHRHCGMTKQEHILRCFIEQRRCLVRDLSLVQYIMYEPTTFR